MNLRRSLQMLVAKVPVSLRRFVKRHFMPNFLLRYLSPAPANHQQHSKYPARGIRRDGGLEVEFRPIRPGDFFEDSFTHRTVRRVRGSWTREFLPTPTVSLTTAAPERAPVGIIFHVGRCGSTLVCELLKCVRGLTVYSEPYIVDDVLAPPNEWKPDQIIAGLRLVAALYYAHADGPYVWKLRGANTLFCDRIIRAFPETPWIFCVRDPLEVAVSDSKDPPYWLRPFGNPINPFLSYFTDNPQEDLSREVYIARAFAGFCRAISKTDWTRGQLVKYEQLPDAVWSTIGPHFGLSIDRFEREAMAERALFYSKAKRGERIAFNPDVSRKWSTASDELKSAVDLYARPALADLLSRQHCS